MPRKCRVRPAPTLSVSGAEKTGTATLPVVKTLWRLNSILEKGSTGLSYAQCVEPKSKGRRAAIT